jgi:hypothetical protein
LSKSGKNNRSIAGNWLGNYYYNASAQAFGFEAVFIESNGAVQGSILDDGYLGEAQVTGTFAAPSLSFTKAYPGRDSVNYRGEMSDDGNMLSGTWRISNACHGTWAAFRNREDEDEDIRDVEQQLDIEQEQETQRPLVAPAKSR